MPWTPQNLTDPSFVQTKLSPLDRSNALLTMNNSIDSIGNALARNRASLEAAQDLTNGPLSFGTVRDARNAARDAAAAGAPNAAALQAAYEDLQAKRSIATADADKFLRNVQDGEDALKTAKIAVNNLVDAGAVPPGTNQFAPPPGYAATINPPSEVPASQNPTNTITTNTNVENPIATSVTDPAQARQQAILNEANAEIQAEPAQLSINSDPNLNFNEGAVEGTRAEMQRQAELQAIERQEAEAQQIAEQQFIDNEPSSAGGSGAYIENANPQFIGGEDPFEAARQQSEEEFNNSSARTEQDIIGAYGGMQGLQGSIDDTRAKQITQDAENAKTKGDWRVRLSLAPSAGYLYKAENPGILGYLQATDGVVFPYTPQISVNYAAHYEPSDLVHSNYKLFQYKNSSVDQVTITCDFTAQDTFEANYLLAVIHFFRSVTKMFYGKDQQPGPGVPPPLCYLSGLGEFQFDKHPLVITNFNYSLPNDVDYIRAGSPTLEPGVNASMYQYQENPGLIDNGVSCRRLDANGLVAGGGRAAPNFSKATNTQPTYVPTKIQIALTAFPIATRNDISNNFSLREYATGKLLQGSKNVGGGGIW